MCLLVKEIPEFSALKFNHDLTLYVLNMVINLVKSKKIDIKTVAIQVLSKVHGLSEEETNILAHQIDYLISSKAVKKIANSTLLFKYLKKKNYKYVKIGIQNYVSNTLSNTFMPLNFYSNVNQIVTYFVLSKLGINGGMIALIILFL